MDLFGVTEEVGDAFAPTITGYIFKIKSTGRKAHSLLQGNYLLSSLKTS